MPNFPIPGAINTEVAQSTSPRAITAVVEEGGDFGPAAVPLVTGARPRFGRMEVGTAFRQASAPAVVKPAIFYERAGQPGILTYLWMAGTASATDPFERGSLIRIYADDATNAVLSVPVADFFMASPSSDVFNNQVVGRTWRDYVSGTKATGYYRYVFIPYQKFIRAELVNQGTADATIWLQASAIDLPAPYAGPRKRYRMSGQALAAQAPQTSSVFATPSVNAAGMIEAVWIAWTLNAESGNTSYIFEGNIDITIDNETWPTFWTTGGEDFPNGAFGTVPIGGFPGGRNNAAAGSASYYRFFSINEPFQFTQTFNATWHMGQAGQPLAPAPNGTVDGSIYVSWWENVYNPVNYWDIDTLAVPLVVDNFQTGVTDPTKVGVSIATSDNGKTWNNPGAGDTFKYTATGTAKYATAADSDRYAYIDLGSQPANFWVEGKFNISSATANAEAGVWCLGSTATAFGSHVTVELKRVATNDWYVIGRDDFNITGQTKVDVGLDLSTRFIWLGLKVIGQQVTAYYKYDGETVWRALCRWNTSQTGSRVGLAQWTGTCEIDSFAVRPLKNFTS